jgi:hypothetical protein
MCVRQERSLEAGGCCGPVVSVPRLGVIRSPVERPILKNGRGDGRGRTPGVAKVRTVIAIATLFHGIVSAEASDRSTIHHDRPVLSSGPRVECRPNRELVRRPGRDYSLPQDSSFRRGSSCPQEQQAACLSPQRARPWPVECQPWQSGSRTRRATGRRAWVSEIVG